MSGEPVTVIGTRPSTASREISIFAPDFAVIALMVAPLRKMTRSVRMEGVGG